MLTLNLGTSCVHVHDRCTLCQDVDDHRHPSTTPLSHDETYPHATPRVLSEKLFKLLRMMNFLLIHVNRGWIQVHNQNQYIIKQGWKISFNISRFQCFPLSLIIITILEIRYSVLYLFCVLMEIRIALSLKTNSKKSETVNCEIFNMTENWEKSNKWNKFKSIELYLVKWFYGRMKLQTFRLFLNDLCLECLNLICKRRSEKTLCKKSCNMQLNSEFIDFSNSFGCDSMWNSVSNCFANSLINTKHMQMRNSCSYVFIFNEIYIICDVWGKYWLIFFCSMKMLFWLIQQILPTHNRRHLFYSILNQQCHECQETLERSSMM